MFEVLTANDSPIEDSRLLSAKDINDTLRVAYVLFSVVVFHFSVFLSPGLISGIYSMCHLQRKQVMT